MKVLLLLLVSAPLIGCAPRPLPDHTFVDSNSGEISFCSANGVVFLPINGTCWIDARAAYKAQKPVITNLGGSVDNETEDAPGEIKNTDTVVGKCVAP